jgi:hypothetical protein
MAAGQRGGTNCIWLSMPKREAKSQTIRDRHVQGIAKKGRVASQKATGYGRRSLAETAIGRYKHFIGS